MEKIKYSTPPTLTAALIWNQNDNMLPDIDECASDPCMNGGACTHAVDLYTCDCTTAPGYEGTQCEIGNKILKWGVAPLDKPEGTLVLRLT